MLGNAHRRGAALVLVAALALGACGGDDDSGGASGDGGTGSGVDAAETVETKGLKFSPATVSIKAGETVVWLFNDKGIPHNVRGDELKSPTLKKGEWSHTFEEAGTFDYICSIHPNMKGTVQVS